MNLRIRFTPAANVRRGARLVRSAALFFSLAFGSTGCAILGGGEHLFGDASLGDAAEHAKPDSSKMRREDAERRSRPLDVGWRDSHAAADLDAENPPLALEYSAPRGAPSNQRPPHQTQQNVMFGLVAGAGGFGGDRYDGYGLMGIHVGDYLSPRWRADLIGSVGGVNFAGQSVAGQSFRNEVELAIDLNTRYYLSAPHTFLGVYPIGGVRFGTLFWKFARPIPVTEDGQTRTIDSDRVGYFSLYGGAGLALMQLRHVQFGGHVTAGVRLYSWQTKAGFSNDLFPATGFVQVMIETSYRR